MNEKYPNADAVKVALIGDIYVKSVDELYGHHLDSIAGFGQLFIMVENLQTHMRKEKIPLPENKTDDDSLFAFGSGSPIDPAHRIQHVTTQGAIKHRNANGGKNHIRAGQQLIVLLYSFWEHEYRPKFAKALGLTEPDELRIPLFGEIRLLRHDILHHNALFRQETVKKLSLFSNAQQGKQIVISDIVMENLI